MYCPIVFLAKELVSIPSISPSDFECQNIIAMRLLALGFNVMLFKNKHTSNLWAYRGIGLIFSFAGHTDVVPAGTLMNWKTPPFRPVIKDGILFGRGTSDMKGALAAMIIAAERFILSKNNYLGQLSFLITSDEESSAKDGTIRLVEYLKSIGNYIKYCIIGEPTSSHIIGDTIKIGRRGSLHANICIYGIQGHIAYPKFAVNPIHNAAPFINSFINKKWTTGNKYFIPTSMQISDVYSGNNSENIIPGQFHIRCNFRFGTDISNKKIQFELNNLLKQFNFKYTVKWRLSGVPYLTHANTLVDIVKKSIYNIHIVSISLSTDGGISDGRFLKLISSQLIEIGLKNNTIHQVNEHVKIQDLQILSLIYLDIIKKILI
ncbi:Succinyl-diaminopimelate desuccinylase [Buchnera aphidicola (Takecallis arundicolens)]|uniref:succinyl-diaminopimelate desuccinylase n=1 Tax=Buchnera aphidicola TaxID=9 RepID=UPI0034640A85